jgi:glutathione reductase (NADPH)
VGGGYIAAELSGIFRALGSEVTIVLRARRMLHHFDELLGDSLVTALTAAGIDVLPGLELSTVRREGSELVAGTSEGGAIHADCLIWAIGRVPNTNFVAPAAGVRLDAGGSVWVDAFQNTSRAGVYAVGDVTGRAPLTPVAIAAGRRLADRLFGGEPQARLDYDQVPTVVFSHPPIATVGLSEGAARAVHGDGVKCYTRLFRGLYYAVTSRSSPAAVKLVTAGPEERVLGIHAIGLGADELIQGFSVALRMGATKADFDRTLAVHPTLAEELVTLR